MGGSPSTGRVVNACEGCGRPYDVTHLETGRRVHCACGETFSVRRLEARAPRALRCSACGGNLVEGARECAYCAAQVTLRELRLDSVCPRCFARCSSEARFCMDCGVELGAQALFPLPEGLACPRCRGTLRLRELGSTPMTECGACGGLWLPNDVFERLCQRGEAESVAPGTFAAPSRSSGLPAREGYIPCLACSQLMQRRNYATNSGVIVDVCREHGVWLDADELERVLAFVRSGGLERARERQIDRLREEQRRLRAAEQASWSPAQVSRSAHGEAWGLGGELGLGGLLELFGDLLR